MIMHLYLCVWLRFKLPVLGVATAVAQPGWLACRADLGNIYGVKEYKKYYLIHLFPKKIGSKTPKMGSENRPFLEFVFEMWSNIHEMVIFKDIFSIFHVTKLCSKKIVIYGDKNFKLFIPDKTEKLKYQILSFREKKSNVMYIFLHILKVKLKSYILLRCAIKK